ncbi:MAG TPA: SpoIID/LytB domain-containing protein [Acidimicrobiales bacterium]|nr:SpoIID/LytB domain-containing protein [Acidimicrobiales bacterium]
MTRSWRLLAVVALLAAALVVGDAGVSPVRAYPGTHVNLTGHGWGHGRGMGQYGAQGYATNHGWAWDRILGHYYSNTTMSDIGNPAISVHITRKDGQDMILEGPLTVDGVGGAHGATLVRRIGANQLQVFTSGGCGGTGGWVSRAVLGGPVRVHTSGGSTLALCESGLPRLYRGRMEVVDGNGAARLVNHLDLQGYLYGVVPRESPGWFHAEALRAQAVAARSYAAASNRDPYANQCDTISCQVYGGKGYKGGDNLEGATTTAAVDFTHGKVRRFGDGRIASTEFSSSTGGYTAGGAFPAVPDAGDNVSSNPNHTWTAAVPVSDIQARYPSLGTLVAVDVTNRNGLGDMGGRVTSLVLRGSNGNVTLTGNQFRSAFGLKSDWFSVQGQPSGGVDGYWAVAPDGGIFTFGNAPFYGSMGGQYLAKPIVGMAAKPDSTGYWMVATDGGIFTFGGATFFGSMGGKPLNKPIVGMAPTPSGNGYWMVASDGGIFTFGDAAFLGSMGGLHLNKPIVGMASTPSGNGYWMVASDGGIFTFGDAAFLGSTGGQPLNSPVVGMTTTRNGQGYWLLAADGGIFTFGVPFHGSLPGIGAPGPAVDMRATSTDGGYLIVTDSGHVYPFGDAPNFGQVAGTPGFRGGIEGMEVRRY